MRSFRPALLLALCAIFICSALALQSSQTPQATATPLTNKDVLDMLKAGLTPEIVIAKIKSSTCNFDTSPDALKALKAANVPDAVIVAMVQTVPTPPVRGETIYVSCIVREGDIHSTPLSFAPVVATVPCGTALTSLRNEASGYVNGYVKVRTEEGAVGYIPDASISQTKPQMPSTKLRASQPVVPSATNFPPHVLRAVAWRAVPWVTTSYYQQPGSANTDCTGSGTWFGNIWQGNSSCTTQYTPAQNVPINWYHYTVYNLVETADSWLVVACTRNWAFSKCSYLIPGNVFSFDYKKGKISITGHRAGKDKEQSLDFDIVSSQPKS